VVTSESIDGRIEITRMSRAQCGLADQVCIQLVVKSLRKTLFVGTLREGETLRMTKLLVEMDGMRPDKVQ